MHDLDRTTLETNGFDFEDEMDYEDEMDDEMDDEYDYEMDDEYDDEMDDEYDYEMDYESGSPFNEEEEAELAYELLSVNSEEEMDEFIRSLFSKAKKGLRKIWKSPITRAIGRGLRKVAKVALPIAGKAVGSIFGGPIGGMAGGGVGSGISQFFEIELEGLSPEDQEFEVAKRIVRLGGAATRNSMKNARRMPAAKAVKLGFKKAAQQHAPGLLRIQSSVRPVVAQKSGRWYKIGDKIVIIGLTPSASAVPSRPIGRTAPPKRRTR